MTRFRNVELIDVTIDREFYTRHGQHLNSRGKESMASKIAQSIERLVKKKDHPISMKWQDDAPPIKESTTQLHDDATTKEKMTQHEHNHLNIQERSITGNTDTTTVLNVTPTTITQYPINDRAPDANTSLEINNGIVENPNVARPGSANGEASFDETTQDEPLHQEPRTSRRKKKPPTTKNYDFLWDTTTKC